MISSLFTTYERIYKILGMAKFAVVIILLFAIYLTYGTFMESYHGADYANRHVYKSWPFMLLQLLMFLSIVVATLQRFPIKKHLHGFYVIHLGLIVLFLGSFITYQAGVDGNLTLPPNTPSREILLNEDQLTLQFLKESKEITIELPYSAQEKKLNFESDGIKVLRFLPYSELTTEWIEDKFSDTTRMHSGTYRLENDNFGEDLTLSLHSKADFESTLQLGPLNVHYMPELLAECFGEVSYRNLLIWDARNGVCFAPKKDNLTERKGVAGKSLIIIKDKGQEMRFLPELSPLPVDKDLKIMENSEFRIFSRSLFQDKPHLFIFGRNVSYFDKEEKKWIVKKLEPTVDEPLPWMGFRLRLNKHYNAHYPVKSPQSVKPIQDNGQIIKGATKAIEVEVGKTRFWVTNAQPMSLERSEGRVNFILSRKSLKLPFEITLDNFKMDTDPGTNNPASYESFVTLFKGNAGSEKHHVFMNNPMKYSAFTFYQASYFESEGGTYGSVFSVNYDPGRPWKYIGSLLLVLGSMWHFVLRRRPTRPTPEVKHA
jgi:hypothetical protein